MKPLAFKTAGLVCLLCASAGLVRAVDLQTLVDRSPFAPPGQGPDTAGAAEPQGTLEFRGMVTDEAGTAYSIFDTSTNKGRWVRSDDTNSPVQVKGFDAANNTLEVEQNGRSVKLSLKRATIQAGQAVNAMIPSAPPPQIPGNPANQGEARKSDGTADARRLEAVAAEVRRRRALRNAARPPQGQPPANAAPAPVPAPAP